MLPQANCSTTSASYCSAPVLGWEQGMGNTGWEQRMGTWDGEHGMGNMGWEHRMGNVEWGTWNREHGMGNMGWRTQDGSTEWGTWDGEHGIENMGWEHGMGNMGWGTQNREHGWSVCVSRRGAWSRACSLQPQTRICCSSTLARKASPSAHSCCGCCFCCQGPDGVKVGATDLMNSSCRCPQTQVCSSGSVPLRWA